MYTKLHNRLVRVCVQTGACTFEPQCGNEWTSIFLPAVTTQSHWCNALHEFYCMQLVTIFSWKSFAVTLQCCKYAIINCFIYFWVAKYMCAMKLCILILFLNTSVFFRKGKQGKNLFFIQPSRISWNFTSQPWKCVDAAVQGLEQCSNIAHRYSCWRPPASFPHTPLLILCTFIDVVGSPLQLHDYEPSKRWRPNATKCNRKFNLPNKMCLLTWYKAVNQEALSVFVFGIFHSSKAQHAPYWSKKKLAACAINREQTECTMATGFELHRHKKSGHILPENFSKAIRLLHSSMKRSFVSLNITKLQKLISSLVFGSRTCIPPKLSEAQVWCNGVRHNKYHHWQNITPQRWSWIPFYAV